MNSHPSIIYALGCARGAAMSALCPADLDTLTDDQIVARIVPVMGRAPLATESQLSEWIAADEGGLYGLDDIWKWRRTRAAPTAEKIARWRMVRRMRQAQAAAAPVTPEAPAANWAALHGLDALDGSKKWKKRLKRLKKNLKIVAAFAVGPTMGGKKGIEEQIKFVKKNPLLVTAAGLFTGNPLLIKAGQELKKRKDAGKTTAPAEAEPAPAMDATMAYQAPAAQRLPAYAALADYAPTTADTGPVTRLAPDEAPGRVVGLNWGGIADSIKANPVPWALGAATGLYLITRRP